MAESQSQKVSRHEQRPTERLVNYDSAQGRLSTLSKSVGRRETPPTAEEQAAERAKEQAKIAASCGNTSLPGPLKPLKCTASHLDDDDSQEQDEANYDPNARPAITDYLLEELEDETNRMEWLYQNIELFGSRNDLRDNPKYQAEDSLLNKLGRLKTQGPRASHGALKSGNVHCVKTGSTHILEPETSGHSSHVWLVRTDHTTVGLDGNTVNAHSRREHGLPMPVKLSCTNQTTIGLDSKLVSSPGRAPPRRAPQRASAPLAKSKAPSTAPSKKQAVISMAWMKELRKQNAKSNGGACTKPPVVIASLSSRPQPNQPRLPPPDIEMCNLSTGDEVKHPAPEGEEGSDPEVEDDGEEVPVHELEEQLTKRQRLQLGAFVPEARPLVQLTTELIKINMATICPYPETISENPRDQKRYIDHWLVERWAQANKELRKGKDLLPFKDEYGAYVRKQLPVYRNIVKQISEVLVPVYYNLHCSDPKHTECARKLTSDGEERWTLPARTQHQIIINVIVQAFFWTSKSLGYRYIEQFILLVPLATIAYICTIIRTRIKAFETKDPKAAELDASKDSNNFSLFMRMLNKTCKKTPGHLLDARLAITIQYLQARLKKTREPTPEMNFGEDCEIDMERMEQIRELAGEDMPDIDQWDGVCDVQRNCKGRGQASARAGPSGSDD
ncbi:hypothetical protein RhiJN_24456 [Ceratobasidium sp. AG-Ba]|nr:hypothetical protein RhiJN_24456 [Ceratobasidium sp. AG-Ba]